MNRDWNRFPGNGRRINLGVSLDYDAVERYTVARADQEIISDFGILSRNLRYIYSQKKSSLPSAVLNRLLP